VILAGEPVREFSMFEVGEVTVTGASLTGPLFLEVGEMLMLKVASVEVRAEVVAIASAESCMKVSFVQLSEEARKALEAL
jgi:hypothetical protein